MNLFEISTRPPNSYLFSSTSNALNSPVHNPSYSNNSNHIHSNHYKTNNNQHNYHNPYDTSQHYHHHPHNHFQQQQQQQHQQQHHPTCQHHQCQNHIHAAYCPSAAVTNASKTYSVGLASPSLHHQSRRSVTNTPLNAGTGTTYLASRTESPHINLKQRSSSTNSQFPRNNLINTAQIRYNGLTNQYANGNNSAVKAGESVNGNFSTPSSPYISNSGCTSFYLDLLYKF